MQICTSSQTDNHASISPLSFLQAGCPSCHPTNSVEALKAKINTHTHTHNHITALWTLSGTTRVIWYQKEHFAIFWIFWCKMKITQADTPIIQMDCHPIQTNQCPHLCHPTIFMPDSLPDTTLPIYPGLGHAPNMLACIPGGLVAKNTRWLGCKKYVNCKLIIKLIQFKLIQTQTVVPCTL